MKISEDQERLEIAMCLKEQGFLDFQKMCFKDLTKLPDFFIPLAVGYITIASVIVVEEALMKIKKSK